MSTTSCCCRLLVINKMWSISSRTCKTKPMTYVLPNCVNCVGSSVYRDGRGDVAAGLLPAVYSNRNVVIYFFPWCCKILCNNSMLALLSYYYWPHPFRFGWVFSYLYYIWNNNEDVIFSVFFECGQNTVGFDSCDESLVSHDGRVPLLINLQVISPHTTHHINKNWEIHWSFFSSKIYQFTILFVIF